MTRAQPGGDGDQGWQQTASSGRTAEPGTLLSLPRGLRLLIAVLGGGVCEPFALDFSHGTFLSNS